MEELDQLLKPIWGAEPWILEGWNCLTLEEKEQIKSRLSALFQNGLPFEIKQDKRLYIYTFSLMAQLEVLGIQLPIRFGEKLQQPAFKERMRAQLVDEIFHAILFTKIVFLLCEPYQLPPIYNKKIETICNFVRAQECLKLGIVVMNLICEGLVEEIFTTLCHQGVAPEVFSLVLADEHRHVCEAELYSEIGLPDAETLSEKLHQLEALLVSTFLLEPQYSSALSALLGTQGSLSFLAALNARYTQQLAKINQEPSEKWALFFKYAPTLYQESLPYADELDKEVYEIPMSATQKNFMIQMHTPGDPTMVAQFELDVSRFYCQPNLANTNLLTPLMLQAMSRTLQEHASFRCFLSFNKLYQTRSAYVALINQLPDYPGHLATIYFRNAHELSAEKINARINRALQMMTYCYRKREQIDIDHPEIKADFEQKLLSQLDELYPYPVPGSQSIYLCNLGEYGYTQATAPLLKQMGLTLLMLTMQKKAVWDHTQQAFLAKEILPISISADSRVFHGLIPIPQLLQEAWDICLAQLSAPSPSPCDLGIKDPLLQELLAKISAKNQLQYAFEIKKVMAQYPHLKTQGIMSNNLQSLSEELLHSYLSFTADEAENDARFLAVIDHILKENLTLGYRTLVSLQSAWPDYVDVEALLQTANKKVSHARLHHLAKRLHSKPRRGTMET